MLVSGARRPNDYDEATSQISRRDETGLTIIPAVVGKRRPLPGKHLFGIGKIQAALRERRPSLGLVPGADVSTRIA
jgi:hypothetical protein